MTALQNYQASAAALAASRTAEVAAKRRNLQTRLLHASRISNPDLRAASIAKLQAEFEKLGAIAV
jgi:hypothetical protein